VVLAFRLMRHLGCWTALGLLLLGGTQASGQSLLPSSTGSSRQVMVFALEPGPRMKAASEAENLKSSLLRFLRMNDRWEHPLVINVPEDVRRKPREAIQTGVFEGDGSTLKVQIDIYDSSLIGTDAFREAVMQGLLIEMIYRGTTLRAGRNFQRPPQWLVEALLAELQSPNRANSPAEVAATLAQQDPPANLSHFLRDSNNPTAVERTRRRVAGQALLRTLLETPERSAGFLDLLRSVPEERDPLRQILTAFPSIEGDPERLNRLWSLTLARMALPNRTTMLTAAQTRRELAEILEVEAQVDARSPESPMVQGAAAFPSIARETYGRQRMGELAHALMELELRAHPLYRGVIADYRQIAQDLARRPRSRVDRRLEMATELRVALDSRFSDIEDYMNWFEVNRLSAPDPDFVNLLEYQFDMLEPEIRRDTITRHLDRLEKQL